MIFSLIYFLIALGIIVLVHEFGHLIVAKRNGVHCHEFSIGMGPKILHFHTDSTGCKYNIRLFPLGGFVMLAGEDHNQEQDNNLEHSQMLNTKSPWVRFKVLIAGSLMNFILGIFLLFLISFFGGINNLDTSYVNVVDGYPAKEAGISNGAEIISINDIEVNTFAEISSAINTTSSPLVVIVNEDGVEKEVEITPDENNAIGVTPTVIKYKFFESFKNSIISFFSIVTSIFVSLSLLFTPEYGVSDLSGPVGIYTMSSSVLSYGLKASLTWITYLSINIGLVNLFPIPALDGGRLVFVIYEMIFKKKPNPKIEENALLVGVLLLFSLFIFVTINDIFRLF